MPLGRADDLTFAGEWIVNGATFQIQLTLRHEQCGGLLEKLDFLGQRHGVQDKAAVDHAEKLLGVWGEVRQLTGIQAQRSIGIAGLDRRNGIRTGIQRGDLVALMGKKGRIPSVAAANLQQARGGWMLRSDGLGKG